jgi:dolichyl-diphosphooligosaccharide--protein glycosyltransferase
MSSASKTPSKAGATVSPKKLGTAGASTAGAAKEAKKSAAGSIFSVGNLVRSLILVVVGWVAYDIRLHAIKEYGLVIHEFDPWFNYRATEYLDQHGLEKFFKWFDYMSWYPLGRPVGTTIYPGMQMTSVFIKNTLNNMGYPISLNDVCCYVPAWFGVSATYFLGLLTYECSNNANAAVASTAIMAIVPAHIMRSVGGGYDNESIAMTAMMMTFFLWTRSLRTKNSWWIGIFAGVAYIYMVAAWGGFIFVLNMVALHAAGLVIVNRYSSKLHRAYSLFYIIGTAGAIQIPVQGWKPLKDMEQLGGLAVFLALQLLEVCEYFKRQQEKKNKEKLNFYEVQLLRMKVFGAAGAMGIAALAIFTPAGYFGPLSSRVRGLFLRHTRTGNPLVDSVAEHQPATADAYFRFLHYVCLYGPIGFAIACFKRTDAGFFLIFYAVTAYYFCNKMSRLIILLGPIASALGGIALSFMFNWSFTQFDDVLNPEKEAKVEKAAPTAASATTEKSKAKKMKKLQRLNKGKTSLSDTIGLQQVYEEQKPMRKGMAIFFVLMTYVAARQFWHYSHVMARNMSHPSIMFKANLRNGETIMVDDYREAYWWLRDNTPEDARVMAWWDYGYQITGIANRTTIADGNTWNHEHIATLGRCLTSPVKQAHRIIKHIADYVLIWTGGGGDDLAKSPHMARIGNSVYHDICPGDPTCSKYGFVDQQGTPTPMMAKSLLYKLHGHGQVPGVRVDKNRFKEVFTSTYNKVRIFQVMHVSEESKRWIADPANRICDAPGSWYCTGQYPPAMDKLMAKKQDFAQLEDFNVKKGKKDEEYQKQYHKRMNGEVQSDRTSDYDRSKDDEYYEEDDDIPEDIIDEEAPKWRDTASTTRMWNLIHENDIEALKAWIEEEPEAVHIRSSDGRGPLWWAYEHRNKKIVKLLKNNGADPKAKDKDGLKPKSMMKKKQKSDL